MFSKLIVLTRITAATFVREKSIMYENAMIAWFKQFPSFSRQFSNLLQPVKMHKVIFTKTFEKVRENKGDGGDGILHPRDIPIK
jgi:hypothetical protein